MTTPNDPHWHVLGDQIAQDTELSPAGTGIDRVFVVPYVIDSGPGKGHRGSVRVPPDQFNETTVADMIRGAVSRVHGVGGLANPPAGPAA
jgi:hypothetical protein